MAGFALQVGDDSRLVRHVGGTGVMRPSDHDSAHYRCQADLNEVASGHGQRGRDILWSSGNISQCRIRLVESPQPYCK